MSETPIQRTPPLPGVAGIALYLALIAGVIILGVASGGHYPAIYLVFSAVFLTACAGLLVSFRWAWALALAAVFLLMVYNCWAALTQRSMAAGVQGFLNLVFFLYLIRPEVRGRMK